jgi:hypothetical protein
MHAPGLTPKLSTFNAKFLSSCQGRFLLPTGTLKTFRLVGSMANFTLVEANMLGPRSHSEKHGLLIASYLQTASLTVATYE